MHTPLTDSDNFDEFAANYRLVHNKNMQLLGGDSYYFAAAKVRHVKDYESDIAPAILDVGCGDGATAVSMKLLFPCCRINGIDVSAESIEMAKAKKVRDAVFSVYNGSDFPFADNCFDLLFIAGVLHHVSSPVQERLAAEAFRVLKKGGRVHIFEHNPHNPATRYLVKTCPFDKYAILLKEKQVTHLLKAYQFSGIKRRYITFFPQNKFFSNFHAVEKMLGWCPAGAQYYIRAVK